MYVADGDCWLDEANRFFVVFFFFFRPRLREKESFIESLLNFSEQMEKYFYKDKSVAGWNFRAARSQEIHVSARVYTHQRGQFFRNSERKF